MINKLNSIVFQLQLPCHFGFFNWVSFLDPNIFQMLFSTVSFCNVQSFFILPAVSLSLGTGGMERFLMVTQCTFSSYVISVDFTTLHHLSPAQIEPFQVTCVPQLGPLRLTGATGDGSTLMSAFCDMQKHAHRYAGPPFHQTHSRTPTQRGT